MMKKKIKVSLITILVLITSLFYYKSYSWYVGCVKNHSETLKVIGKSMQDNVLVFYKEHHRYPTFQETEVLLKKSGCSNIKLINNSEYGYDGIVYTKINFYNCTYALRKIEFRVTIGDMTIKNTFAEPYDFVFGKGNSHCSMGFSEGGEASGSKVLTCSQGSCLFSNWSH